MESIFKRYRQAYSGLPREVWILALTLFINRCGSMVLAFLSLFLLEGRGYPEWLTGVAFGVFGLGSIIGAYMGGRMTEWFGAIRVQTVGLFLSVPGFLIVPYCSEFWQILVALFFLSMTSEAVRPANSTAVAQFASEANQTKAFALQRLAVNLGLSIGPAVGGFLAEVNFDLLFIVDGLSTLCGALAFLYFFRMRRFTTRAEQSAAEVDSVKHRSPLWDWQFSVLLGLVLLTAICFFQYHVTYPLYMRQDYHLEKWMIGLLFAVNTVMIVIFEMVLVDYAKRWRMLSAIGWGCVLSCLGFGMLPWGVALPWFWLSITFCIFSAIIITIGEMLAMPIATGWVAKRSRGKNQSVYMGWYSMTYSVACMIGPVLGSKIYEFDHDLVWHLTMGIGVIVAIGFWLFVRATERENESESLLKRE